MSVRFRLCRDSERPLGCISAMPTKFLRLALMPGLPTSRFQQFFCCDRTSKSDVRGSRCCRKRKRSLHSWLTPIVMMCRTAATPGAWSTAISQSSRWCRSCRFTIGPACSGLRNWSKSSRTLRVPAVPDLPSACRVWSHDPARLEPDQDRSRWLPHCSRLCPVGPAQASRAAAMAFCFRQFFALAPAAHFGKRCERAASCRPWYAKVA